MKVSTSAGLNVVQANDIYIAVPWSTSSGGAVALVPLEQRGMCKQWGCVDVSVGRGEEVVRARGKTAQSH